MPIQLVILTRPGSLGIDTRKHISEYNFRVPGVNLLAMMDYKCILYYSSAYTTEEIINSIKAANKLADDEVVLNNMQ